MDYRDAALADYRRNLGVPPLEAAMKEVGFKEVEEYVPKR